MAISSTTYADFVSNVRSWTNRDSDVLPDIVIQDAMSYAADTAYKELRIPALEANVTYTIIAPTAVATALTQVKIDSTTDTRSVVKLPVPADIASFIHLRVKSSGNTGKEGVVINEKTDVRTFWDMYADRYSGYYWARQTNFILVAGDFAEGDELELHYYRRLPALDARYTVNATNFNLGLVNVATIQPSTGTTLYFANGTAYPPIAFTDTAYATQNTAGDRVGFYFDPDTAGVELDHWLRDENRKVLLFGALYQCFDYLDDTVQSQKYYAKFKEAMDELNREEKRLRASGGNIQMHFNSQLI